MHATSPSRLSRTTCHLTSGGGEKHPLHTVLQFHHSLTTLPYKLKRPTRSSATLLRIVAPAIRTSFNVAHTSIIVLQYPIPSQQTVTSITTKTVDTTRWALGVVGREVFFYVDMVDVSVTRALAKARWSVLGFGQYAGLSQEQRCEKNVRRQP